jgi:Protein of unknown function (DUF3225)
MEVDRADVVAEVTAAFQAYEKALVDGDNELLVGWFWDDPALVRFGLADEQRGFPALRDWRLAQGPLPGRRLYDTVVTAFGTGAAIVSTGFDYPAGTAPPGRQSQTWVRTPQGWRIVHAHVSHPA